MNIVPRFMWSWPSWVVEFLSGLITASLTQPFARPPLACFVIAMGLSLFYERVLDPNGFDWNDVEQRTLGILAGVLVWGFVRGAL